MDFPTLDRKTLAMMDGVQSAILTPSAPIYSVNTAKPKPSPPKALTTEECIKLFGVREAVTMNFIPQMLTALALDQAESFIQYCRDNRLGEYKRLTREMRKCIDEYNAALRKSYDSAWYVYQNYLERLRSAVELDLFKCWCTFTNEASRQYVGLTHREIPARVAFIRMILDYVEMFDKKMDKMISDRVKAPCNRKQDPYCLLISVLCIDIADNFGKPMQVTDTMSISVKVLHNRCLAVVDEIMAEEDAHNCHIS